MDIAEVKYEMTQHVLERYAERVMGKEETRDIKLYATEYKDKLVNDIHKLIEYSEVVYEGKSNKKDKNGSTQQIQIRVSGTWVIIIASDSKKVITLFKFDLGFDEEFNKAYANRMVTAVKEALTGVKDITSIITTENETYKSQIAANEERIKEYQKYIKQLEAANTGYKAIVDANFIKVREAETKLNDLIDKLTSPIKMV